MLKTKLIQRKNIMNYLKVNLLPRSVKSYTERNMKRLFSVKTVLEIQ